MENVQIADFSPVLVFEKSPVLTTIGLDFLRTALTARYFGLFFPLCILCAWIGRGRQVLLCIVVAGVYLSLMACAFILFRVPLHVPLQVVVPRIYFHVIPILCLPLFQGLSIVLQSLPRKAAGIVSP